MAIGEHYLITVRCTASPTAKPVENVYVYEQTAGFGNYNDVAVAWQNDILPEMKAICPVQLSINELYIVNLDDVDDFGTAIVDSTGDVNEERLPTYDTWYFQLTRNSRATQNGRKFIGMVPETLQNGGVATSGALINLTLMALALAAPINATPGSAIYQPRIWRRPGTYESGVVAAPGQFYAFGEAVYRKITHMGSREDH